MVVLIDDQTRKQIALAMHEPKRIPASSQKATPLSRLADSSFEKVSINFLFGVAGQKPECNQRIRMIESVTNRGAIALADKRDN